MTIERPILPFATLDAAHPAQPVFAPWWMTCDEFLPPDEMREVMALIQRNAAAFKPSAVLTAGKGQVNPDVRRSRVLYEEPAVINLFEERLLACADTVFERLRMAPFLVRYLEVQITHTGDGEFFRIHNDNSSRRLSSRRITFVYYLHQEPRAFSGGELRLHTSRTDGQRWQPTGDFVDIEPQQNRLVVFPSFLLHELRPVHVPSRQMAHGRLTVNGWFHG